MKKLAVFVNGLSAPIKDDYFLLNWLQENEYEVTRVEPILNENIEKITFEPDLIVGWSMGGLIIPDLALKYPKAKLIMVATGVKVSPGEKLARALFEVVGKEWGLKLLGVGLKLPKKILMDGYEQLNKIPEPEVKEKYRRQMSENIDLFKNLSDKQIKELVIFLRTTDNTEKLKKLINKTIILSGERDKLLPVAEGRKIHHLIKGSTFVTTEGGHYNVIGRNELPILREFLEN